MTPDELRAMWHDSRPTHTEGEMMEILIAGLFVLVSYSLYCTYTGRAS